MRIFLISIAQNYLHFMFEKRKGKKNENIQILNI